MSPASGARTPRLARSYQDLTKVGVKIPNGFAITADAYWRVVKTGGVIDGSETPWPISTRPASPILKVGGKKQGT